MPVCTDTGLKEAMEFSAHANGFLRTLPLQALLGAQSPADVAHALPPIFAHFQLKLKMGPVGNVVLSLIFAV